MNDSAVGASRRCVRSYMARSSAPSSEVGVAQSVDLGAHPFRAVRFDQLDMQPVLFAVRALIIVADRDDRVDFLFQLVSRHLHLLTTASSLSCRIR